MTRVGFCGMGTMGAAMAANLARAGFPLTVWNRTPGRDALPVSLGATTAATPRELAAASDVVVVCVSDTPDVEAVLFGTGRRGRGHRVRRPGHRLLHHLTGRHPRVRRATGEQGVAMVDAPVSGGSEGAQKGTLTIMVGGDEADVERARPVLAAMGKSITHMGPSRRRPVDQGRQPGDPRGQLPGGRGGHGAGHQVRPGPREGRGGALGRRGAFVGAGEPQRPDDRRTTTRSASRSRSISRT